ncbi:universal stress protein [Streptomyces liliiviolaceus]|uniref:universal stress protein n=1 Tax=Streptomyces TaxID=1883 RepID=UPI001FFC3AEB|nr:universal stress protein [Streptomyces liliiviolaceus]
MRTHQVVAGVDGSLVSVRALDRAAAEAARRAAALRILYAVPDLDEAGPILAAAKARVVARHPGLPVTTEAVRGGAVRALTRESEGAALTVVGTRGFSGLTGMLLGSVSLRLAARVHSPLLVVRGDRRCGDGGEVLLGPAGDADPDVAACAIEEAERRGARLRVPRRALLEATRAADVVVIGAHHRRVGPHLGPTAHTLLHRSHCPVLVVPTG